MEIAERTFFVGQAVLAKLKGYPAWPATIVEIQKKKNTVKVVYFGSNNQWSVLGLKKIIPLAAAQKTIDKHYTKNRNFTKAMDEMRLLLGERLARDEISTDSGPSNQRPQKNSHKVRMALLGVPAIRENYKTILKPSTETDKLLLKCRKLTVLIRKLTPEEIAAHCVIKKKTNSKRKKKKNFSA